MVSDENNHTVLPYSDRLGGFDFGRFGRNFARLARYSIFITCVILLCKKFRKIEHLVSWHMVI